ncbi:hypothetical protein ABZ714_18020 [Streptomyces sp. NPDC006798]|uniref:hypothetical protein n=1 Tax=Streptomyces sp. NPDC006798 TaxID=3155462 RepID=UPI0033C5733B
MVNVVGVVLVIGVAALAVVGWLVWMSVLKQGNTRPARRRSGSDGGGGGWLGGGDSGHSCGGGGGCGGGGD